MAFDVRAVADGSVQMLKTFDAPGALVVDRNHCCDIPWRQLNVEQTDVAYDWHRPFAATIRHSRYFLSPTNCTSGGYDAATFRPVLSFDSAGRKNAMMFHVLRCLSRNWNSPSPKWVRGIRAVITGGRAKLNRMTRDEACRVLIEGINYAAYRETDSSLYDADKNRLFGSEQYRSGRLEDKPSPWAEGDFEQKMAILLRWARKLNASDPGFQEAQARLRSEDSVIGRVVRLAEHK